VETAVSFRLRLDLPVQPIVVVTGIIDICVCAIGVRGRAKPIPTAGARGSLLAHTVAGIVFKVLISICGNVGSQRIIYRLSQLRITLGTYDVLRPLLVTGNAVGRVITIKGCSERPAVTVFDGNSLQVARRPVAVARPIIDAF